MFNTAVPEIFMLMFGLLPFIIVLGLIIYIISLLTRMVRAVERIADKIS